MLHSPFTGRRWPEGPDERQSLSGRTKYRPSPACRPALRFRSGRSSLEKPNRWLFVRCADHSSPPRAGRGTPHPTPPSSSSDTG
ncbi:hypothetical protein XW59_024790 [Aquamicrobium sp. LC103]|nr:hypothetical protein XW59_024790 [Aquamicrobium sp. LC103]